MMMQAHTKLPLPRNQGLIRLANEAGSFPMTARDVRRNARVLGFSMRVLAFLKRFPDDARFESHQDFLDRCLELEVLLREKHNAPHERTSSPQD